MKLGQFPLLLLLIFLITACGKAESSKEKIVAITPEQVAHLLENQKFECATLSGGRCPEGVGRVFILNVKDPSTTELCSGFLAQTNRLVTNHHCLSTQAECDNTYVSIFNGDTYEVARCRSVIDAQDDGKSLHEKAIDYAVIELDRHIRTADSFKLTSKQPKSGDGLTAWVVDHVSLFSGRITELSCTMDERRNSLELANCPAIAGNSGSPVVNERGQIVGVLWGSTTSELVNEVTPLEDRRRLNDKAYITDVKHFKNALKKVRHASQR